MDDLAAWTEHIEVIEGWRCIGCGRVEASRPCIGVCQDRRARLVDLGDFVAAVERADNSEARASELGSFVRLVATTRAKPGGAEATRAQALLTSAPIRRSSQTGG